MFQLTRARLGLAFWAFFMFAGAILIAGFVTSTIFADMLLSAAVIAIGLHGLLEEHTHRESRKASRKMDNSLQQLGEWIEKSHLFAKSAREKHELRMHHLDTKRAQAEQRLEKKNRELARRVIDLENRLNSVRKTLAGEKYNPLTSFEKRAARSITVLRKQGMITASVYSARLRVSPVIARNDLKKMAGMKIVRKRGTGRNVYYVLAV